MHPALLDLLKALRGMTKAATTARPSPHSGHERGPAGFAKTPVVDENARRHPGEERRSKLGSLIVDPFQLRRLRIEPCTALRRRLARLFATGRHFRKELLGLLPAFDPLDSRFFQRVGAIINSVFMRRRDCLPKQKSLFSTVE